MHDAIAYYLLALLYDAAVQRETLDRRVCGGRFYPRTPQQSRRLEARVELAAHLHRGIA